jgi:hypothetical protein
MSRRKRNMKIAKFSEGEMVRIKPREHVVQTLDPEDKADGCVFMRQMWDCCGHDFRVRKIVFNFFDEYQYKMYEPRAPLYLLENLICDGITDSFAYRCDRSCYLMWHESWLEKI